MDILTPPRKFSFFATLGFLFDRPASLLFGLWFGVFPVFFMIPFFAVFSRLDVDKPDFELILENGTEVTGTIVKKDPVLNVTVNGEHPVKVGYTYPFEGRNIRDSVQTMSLYTVASWNVGDPVTVMYYQGDSILPDADPSDFPFWIFYFMPVFFAITGLPFLGYSFLGVLKKRNLYSFGEARPAELVSIAPVSSFATIPFFKSCFQIHYYFDNKTGQKVYGDSVTTDLTLINEKKKGDPIAILVNPNNEKSTCVIDDGIMLKARPANPARLWDQ